MTDFPRRVVAAFGDIGVAATVRVSRATRTLVAVRRGPGGIDIAVAERLVVVAGVDTVPAIIAFVMRQPGAAERLRTSVSGPMPELARPTAVGPHPGRHHDLGAIAAFEHATHFRDVDPVPVFWTAPRRGRLLRSIRLGMWDPSSQCIRIHGRLDHPQVPDWYLGFVVYHEYLHRVLDPVQRSRRTRTHSIAFKEREQAHPRFSAAMAWQAEWLPKLLGVEWGHEHR